MEIPMELAFHELETSEFVRAHVRDRVDELQKFHDRIQSVRIAVEAPHRAGDHVIQYRVRVDVRVPGSELVAVSKPSDDSEERQRDAYYAVDDAFDKMETQLRRLAGKLRARRKERPHLMSGVVAALDPAAGTGFIEALDGRELYFENGDIRNAEIGDLEPGDSVRFEPRDESGSPRPRVDYVRV
jgi:ribosomal subunit interface protein